MPCIARRLDRDGRQVKAGWQSTRFDKAANGAYHKLPDIGEKVHLITSSITPKAMPEAVIEVKDHPSRHSASAGLSSATCAPSPSGILTARLRK